MASNAFRKLIARFPGSSSKRRSAREGFRRRRSLHRSQRVLPAGYQMLEQRQLLAGDAPVAIADVFATEEGMSVTINVLANDSDAENDPISIVAVTDGSNGTVVNNSGATVTYSAVNGFRGTDTFTYTIDDGTSQTTADVKVTVNESVDIAAARNAILAGVSTLADPGGPGHMVTFGDTAFSVANYPGENSSIPAVAAATMGEGRVIAVGDHQYLNMNSYGDSVDMEAFYNNGIQWISETANKNIKIVTHGVSASTWLATQGYTNVVDASSATLAVELSDADVLVTWMGSNPSQANLDAVDQFTKDGGGLFLADYGIGYQWWWNRETPDIPGNRLLRDAGIGFVKDWPKGGTQAVDQATDQITADDVLAALQDSSSLSNAEKDLIGNVYRKLNEVLGESDLLQAVLDDEFQTRINSINPTPATPVSDSFDQALLRREMDLIRNLPPDQVTKHRTVADVYGDVPVEATRLVNHNVTVETDHSGYLPTGLYAPAGEVVTIQFPADLVGKGYNVRLSGHKDNISGRSSWNRVPYGVQRSYAIDATSIDVASAFGGAIYIDVGGQAAGDIPNLGDQTVVFDGAVEAPYFVLGETSDADWIAGIRDNPGPFAELVSPGLSISVPSSAIRGLDNPTELMTLWDGAVDIQDWVGGFEITRTGPDRFNTDVQISVGYLHAGYPIQGPTSTAPGIVNHQALTTSGNWGYFHELGHEMQRHPELEWGYDNPWTFSGDIEVTVNIFAAAALEFAAPNTSTSGWGYSAHHDATMQRAIDTVTDPSEPNFEDKDPYPFYFQLADGAWGWQAYRDVLSTYVDQQLNDPGALPDGNTDEKDQWLIRWSTATGHDMTQYMADQWGLEVTQSARDTVAAMNLPSWMPLALQSSASKLSTLPGDSVTVDYANAGMGLDAVATLVEVGTPDHGTLVDNEDGTFDYQAGPFFVGQDVFDVTYRSSAGNTQTFQVTVGIENQGALFERFDGLGGILIDDLTGAAKYPDSPDRTDILDRFEIPSNAADNYGARVRAYVTPPETGRYTFWIASDDNGELWLSNSEDAAGATQIAHVPGWSSSRDWDKFPEQQSIEFELVGGQPYYIEALLKEGGGGDNLAVAWAGPGIDGAQPGDPVVIEGEYLTPFGLAASAPQVESVTVNGGDVSRSHLNKLQVTFETEVLFAGSPDDAFALINRESRQPIDFVTTASIVDGKTRVDFAFSGGTTTFPNGDLTLGDGQYELRIDSTKVGLPGQRLDGNSDGKAGGDHFFGDIAEDAFFRLLGDGDGDRDVDVIDLGNFGEAYLSRAGQPGYDPAMDFDGDGDVDPVDLGEFAERFLSNVPF